MKDAYYFPHDSNAHRDPKCVLLIEELGCEGYGIYFILLEILREQPDYRYPLRLLPALARQINSTTPKIEVTIKNYGLFEIDETESFFSLSFNRRMAVIEQKRELARLAGKKSGVNRQAKTQKQLQELSDIDSSERPFSECSTDVEQGKEIKEKESKENENLSLERDDFDFQTFRKKIRGLGLSFTLEAGVAGYLPATQFIVTSTGYIHNCTIGRDVDPSDAHQIWAYLFKNRHKIPLAKDLA